MTAREVLQDLLAYESRNIIHVEHSESASWPLVWERARGMYVWDLAGKRYLDMTAAFGVAATGHANPRVVAAGKRQMSRLLHAMGDVHPHPLKARLARELSRITFERWPSNPPHHGKTIFCNSGFEAVEAALKTARLATRKPGIIAFEGAYHGLGYGTLNVTHRPHFRAPFQNQLREFGHFLPWPGDEAAVAELPTLLARLRTPHPIGAVLVEPVQVRGGIRIPPPGFLPALRAFCSSRHIPLILDEIYTGFGRTGQWFASEHYKTVPDIICLGKAMTGGFPMSACVGRADWMDRAWPAATGEAIHTSTFLGHPVGCAMALAQIQELQSRNLIDAASRRGSDLLAALKLLEPEIHGHSLHARGLGLLAGLELKTPRGQPAGAHAFAAVRNLAQRGFLFLPEGKDGNVLAFTPPLIASRKQLYAAVVALQSCLSMCLPPPACQ